MISIKFCGAAKTVTGSNYLVTTDVGTFVVDCGMFQGPEVEHLNLEDLTYDASKVDFTLLTHAHIDHSGMLPKLQKAGFSGNIYSTIHTSQITNELILDSAKLQENAYKRGEFYGKHTQIKGLAYNTHDALNTLALFKTVNFDDEFSPVDGIKVKYIRAGHILGAASIEITIKDGGTEKKIIFSGDIGRVKTHIDDSFDLDYSAEADYVLMESLYGGQIHPDRDKSAYDLVEAINKTINRGGNVFIPCFAVQRTQEILNDLRVAKMDGRLKTEIPVWLDSPLAQRVTSIYNKALQNTEEDLFNFPNLIYVKKYKQSVQLTKKSGQVILAGSGMADGGRIMEHLVTGLTNPKNSVIFVGFQAEGTLGRELTEGAKTVHIKTNKIQVNAEIVHLQGFSAHGDSQDYLKWVQRFNTEKLKKVFLVHAEIERSEAFKAQLAEAGITEAYIPSMQEEVQL